MAISSFNMSFASDLGLNVGSEKAGLKQVKKLNKNIRNLGKIVKYG